MRKIGFVLSMLVSVSALPAFSETIALSGTVKDSVTGKGLSGVKVSLATAKDSTTTGSDGSWSLVHSSPTGVGLRSGSSRAVSGHLSLQDGHVVLRYDGHDLLGHSQPGASAATASAAAASLARSSASAVDTLLVSWKDSIRIRYALTSYSATGLQLTFDTSSPSPFKLDTGHFTDARDGQSYKYTKIGSQTWMAQNLNYKRSGSDSGWCYNNDTSNCSKYGRLYNWAESMDTSSTYTTTLLNASSPYQGICPSGWHVPSDAEWNALVQYVDSATSGTKLKANSLWDINTGTDVYGFSVLPAGNSNIDGTFYGLGNYAIFWSSSENDGASIVWDRSFYFYYAYVRRDSYGKSTGFSLRCAQN